MNMVSEHKMWVYIRMYYTGCSMGNSVAMALYHMSLSRTCFDCAANV